MSTFADLLTEYDRAQYAAHLDGSPDNVAEVDTARLALMDAVARLARERDEAVAQREQMLTESAEVIRTAMRHQERARAAEVHEKSLREALRNLLTWVEQGAWEGKDPSVDPIDRAHAVLGTTP
jgi:thioesterase domain-containing protein